MMGTWGTGIYAGDMAADLRGTVSALVQLPFEPDRIVEILCETEPTAANDPNDEDHTAFWLVVADQFLKRGIACDRVCEMAFAIIDSGRDIEMLSNLGMTPSDRAKRKKVLAELRAKLAAPAVVPKPRKTLSKPQPLLMESGDLFTYPTCGGEPINPYFNEKELEKIGWKHDGWGVMMILDCGRAFDFLAWYRPITIMDSLAQKPNAETLHSQKVAWILRNSGTCSTGHFKRMQLEKLGAIRIDQNRREFCFPNLVPGIDAAIKNISIANELSVGSHRKDFFRWSEMPDGSLVQMGFPSIPTLKEITASE